MDNLPTRNNNPGDIRSSSTGFQSFKSPQEGYAALLNDLHAKQTGNTSTGLNSNSSLAEFASKYAPPSDGNDTAKYAADLANKLGVSPDTAIGQLDVGKWADAVSSNEGYQGQYQTYNPKPFSKPSAGTQSPISGAGAIDFSGLPTVAEPTKDNSQFKVSGLLGNLQDVSHGIVKGGTDSILTAGHLGQGIQSLVGKGLDAVTGGKYDFQGDAKQGVFSPTSPEGQQIRQDLKATNTSEKVGKGIETAAEILTPLGGGAKATGILGKTADIGEKIAADIAPRQTAKEAAAALERLGGKKAGLFRKASINPDPALQRMAKIVSDNVPGFKPGGSLIGNINATKQAVSTLAEGLKSKVIESGKDVIYPVKELESAMNKAIAKDDVSIGLKGTQFEKQASALKDAAVQIAKKNGGKVSNLLDSRKEFDALVDKIYPNLYDKEYTPIRNAVKSVRDTMTDFTASHLPADVGLKDSLKNQHTLIKAVENMAEKAASGTEKEVGKSGVINTLDTIRNSKLYKAAKVAGVTGLGIGTIHGILND